MVVPARSAVEGMTLEEFLEYELPDSAYKAELVRGELRLMPPPGGAHGVAASNLVFTLSLHVRRHGLGRVLGDNVGYELLRLPRTVRAPDGSFVRADRLPPAGIGPGLLKLAPDLAVEVLSPSESASELEEKLADYTAAGTPLVWVLDPRRRTVMVVAADAPVRWLGEGDALDGGAVIPGFACPVAELFEGIAREGSTPPSS